MLGGKKRVVCLRAVCARLGGNVVVVVVEAPTYGAKVLTALD